MKKRKMRRKGEPKNPLPPVYKSIKKVYQRKEPSLDFLKYLRVVRYDINKRYGIGLRDLELLLFLYSENLFTRKDFDEYVRIYSWDRRRFGRLLREGWIHKWREHRGKEAALYEVSKKTRQLLNDFYKRLPGEAYIAESERNSPIFRKDASYTDKQYRRAIKRFNNEVREKSSS